MGLLPFIYIYYSLCHKRKVSTSNTKPGATILKLAWYHNWHHHNGNRTDSLIDVVCVHLNEVLAEQTMHAPRVSILVLTHCACSVIVDYSLSAFTEEMLWRVTKYICMSDQSGSYVFRTRASLSLPYIIPTNGFVDASAL